jgi:hypothetical protein
LRDRPKATSNGTAAAAAALCDPAWNGAWSMAERSKETAAAGVERSALFAAFQSSPVRKILAAVHWGQDCHG